MRLFEAIIEANHRACRGDKKAGLHPTEFVDSLPVVALTCIDTRLNALLPNVLALPDDQFIWLRNAGNIITSSLSSTMRSISLACAVKHGKEIVVIGHTDCRVRHTDVSTLIEMFKKQGIPRTQLPDNLAEFFGVFSSEQQNVVRSVDFIRHSPIIGSAVPIHGLMVNTETGYLDWVVNGYETLARAVDKPPASFQPQIGVSLNAVESIGSFNVGEMKFPDGKIGDVSVKEPLHLDTRPIPAPTPVPPPVLPANATRPKNPVVMPPNLKLW